MIAQDEATSVVWGMPGFVARAGLADRVLPLSLIADEIVRRVRVGRGEAPMTATGLRLRLPAGPGAQRDRPGAGKEYLVEVRLSPDRRGNSDVGSISDLVEPTPLRAGATG